MKTKTGTVKNGDAVIDKNSFGVIVHRFNYAADRCNRTMKAADDCVLSITRKNANNVTVNILGFGTATVPYTCIKSKVEVV